MQKQRRLARPVTDLKIRMYFLKVTKKNWNWNEIMMVLNWNELLIIHNWVMTKSLIQIIIIFSNYYTRLYNQIHVFPAMKWILAFIAATKCRYPLVWLWSDVSDVFDTVYPIPAGSSPVSGSSGRESYQAKIYRLHSPLTCQDNVTTVLRTEKIPSGLSPYLVL